MIMTLEYCSLQRVEQETSGRCINVEVNRRPSMRIIRKMALNMWKSHGIEGLPFSWSWLLFMKSAEGWTSNQWSMHQRQQVSSITTFRPLLQLRCLDIIYRRWCWQWQLCKNMFQKNCWQWQLCKYSKWKLPLVGPLLMGNNYCDYSQIPDLPLNWTL